MFNEEKRIQLLVQAELTKIVKDPKVVIQAYKESLDIAEKEIMELKPMAEMYQITMDSEDWFEMSAVSKILNFKKMGRNSLFDYLRQKKIFRWNNEPYQDFVDRGYFKIIEQTYRSNNEIKINRKTHASQKGVDYIAKKLLEDEYELND